jgi:VCBS repeat-containing protein
VNVLLLTTSCALLTGAVAWAGERDVAPRAPVQADSGLVWMDDAALAATTGSAPGRVLPRAEALALVRALNDGKSDHGDWRLPTLAELSRRLACEEAADSRGAAVTRLRAAVAALSAGGADVAVIAPVRGGLIPPGFPNVVVFATHSIHIKNDSQVASGDVVANDASPGPTLAGAELVIGPKASSSATSTLKADSVRVKSRTLVGGDVHYNDLVNQGTINGALVTPLPLPVFAGAPPFKTGTPGATDVAVPPGGTLTLPPGAYRRLDVGQGATVFFTGGVYDFESIEAEQGASLLFDAPSDVRVADRFASGPDALIAPGTGAPITAADVVFFVAGADGGSPAVDGTLTAAEVGVRNAVQANFYVPNGTLHIQNGASATGAFLGRHVEIGPHATLALQSAFFNRAPVAVDDGASGTRGGTITMLDSGATSVLANDSDPNGDALSVNTTPVSGPVHGTLTLNADGTFSYTHDGTLSSSDAFTYEACDEGFPVLCDAASVSITIDIPPYTVTVQKLGTGSGTVVSSPPGIDCGATCSAAFASFLTVALSATPDAGSQFTGFGGDPDCADGVVNGPDDVTCTATFDVFVPVTLTVEKAGTGSGYVSSAPAGIDCGATCSAVFPQSTRVGLGAVAAVGSIFVGWGGAPDCDDGEVVMDAAKTCVATFDTFTPPPPPPNVALTVQKAGDGGGYVSSDPAGIDCGATCSAPFPRFSRVELSVLADAGSAFAGWSGDPDCADGQVALDAAKTCIATFESSPPPPPSSRLTVVLLGSGTGTVTSNPAGIICGGTCEAVFVDGTTVTLFARPEEGAFTGWGGDCAGASFSTSVSIGPDKTCTATFAAP